MVRVLCLEDDEPDEPAPNAITLFSPPEPEDEKDVARADPNLHHRMAVAMSCYPIVSQLATSLDLNSLHDLSRVCRRIRANLLSYRKQLIALALRCDNQNANPAQRLGDAFNASRHMWTAHGGHGAKINRITSGRIGPCARDLVGECRKCSRVVCRNCIMKPPPPQTLRGRHRRLCRACMKADLRTLLAYDVRTTVSDECAVTITRAPCTCHQNVWICATCGHSAKIDDTTYIRGWSWRTRYSTCGGFGTGLGEGVEGVECGRGVNCLGAAVVEKEVECGAGELETIEAEVEKARLEGHAWAGNSYTTHEIIGIGGQVKVKVKKMIVVGATVREHEDERTHGRYLHLEQAGVDRSWCSWCDRVISSKTDVIPC